MMGIISAPGEMAQRLQDSAFLHELNERVRLHQETAIHCPTCLAADKTECLPTAALCGQHPSQMIFFDGADPFHPIDCFGIRPPTTFFCTTKIIPAPGGWNAQAILSSLSAAKYAKDHLNIERVAFFGSSRSPTARQIVDHFQGRREEGFFKPLLDQAHVVYGRAREAAQALGVKEDDKNLCKLVSLELTRVNAANLAVFFGENRKVVAGYFDAEEGTLRLLDTTASLIDLFHGNAPHRHIDVPDVQEPIALCFSCCDSRSNGSHLFSARPGEFINSNSVAVMIPSDGSFGRQQADTSWSDISIAREKGLPIIVVGHSRCGGVHAAVDRQREGTSSEDFLDPWLRQSSRVLDEVCAFASKHGVEDPDLYQLAAKEIVKSSVRTISGYQGDPFHIHALYLDISTRNVEILNPENSIEADYMKMRNESRKNYLYYAPPPPNIYSPPPVCPPPADGTSRSRHGNYANLEWLFDSAGE